MYQIRPGRDPDRACGNRGAVLDPALGFTLDCGHLGLDFAVWRQRPIHGAAFVEELAGELHGGPPID